MESALVALAIAATAATATPIASVAPAAAASIATPLEVQSEQDVLRVFIDCQSGGCDFDHFRREIDFVDYVRDRTDAHVHVLVTRQSTAGGGSEFTVELIGGEGFEGADNRLRYFANATDTSDEIREGLTRMLKLGLLRYVAESPAAAKITVDYEGAAAEDEPANTQPEDDPWNFWVFRTSVNGNFNGEQSITSSSVSGSISANRITEAWKVQLSGHGSYRESRFEFGDDSIFKNITRSYGFNSLIVKSLGDHWSAGFRGTVSSSTFRNLDLGVGLAAAVEYNIFPYAESTRRQFTFRYEVGPTWNDYEEETVFGKTSETLLSESLSASLSTKQPWGTASASLVGSHFFHDLSRYRVSLFASMSVRLVKGLSLNVFGSTAWIRDQLFIPSRGSTPEEILVRRRQLETSYQYFVSVGISYTFGSIYSNVVNPRFSRGGTVIFF